MVFCRLFENNKKYEQNDKPLATLPRACRLFVIDYIVFICFRVSSPVACASDVVSNKTGNGIMI